MMYTPTPAARRPRPPGSLTRQRNIPKKSTHHSNSSSIASSSTQSDTPLSTYIRRRQEHVRTGLARISASPSDVGDVSLDLDVEGQTKPVGLESISTLAEPSPPPPYGTSLPDAPTPPRQDSGMISRRESEVEFEVGMVEEEQGLSEEDVKVSLRAMRASLRQREDELAMATSVLHRFSPHEAGSSRNQYPPNNQTCYDHLSSPLSSSPSPERPFRTVRGKDTSLPFPLQHSNTKPQPRHTSSTQPAIHWARMQVEADERIASLEQALAEARDSEDAQRKLAARLRRDFDKLQRDFERAEERLAREPVQLVQPVGTPRERVAWRRRDNTVDKDLRASHARARVEEMVEVGWGSTAHPQFLARPSRRVEHEPELGEVVDKLERMTVETVRGGRPAMPSMISTTSVQQVEDITSPGSTTSVGSTTLHRAETLSRRSVHRLALPIDNRKIRKKVDASSFAGPPAASSRSSNSLSPRLRIEAVYPPQLVHSPPRISTRRSPIPSPQLPRITAASPTSIGSKMASMRTFVSASLGLGRSPSRGRTLGSELGSEFGAEWDQPLQAHEDTQPITSDDDESDQYYEQPAPLPPNISAALSSLAIAFKPHTDSIPKGSRRGRGLDAEAYELLSEAVRVRHINWADTDEPLGAVTPNLTGWQRGDLWEAGRYPDEPSDSGTAHGLRPSGLHSRPMTKRTVSSGTDGSVALAHRRRTSHLTFDLIAADEDDDWEPTTIPGRVVHDLICLLAILADCVECAVIVLYRILMDIRYGRRADLGLRTRVRMKRYYL